MTAFLPNWCAFDASHSVRLLSGTGGSGRVVALVAPPGFAATSAAPELALEVTRRWADGGEMIILADGCLENPRLHAGFDTDGDRGLSDLLTGGQKLEDVAVAGPTARLKIIPAGGRAVLRDPAQVRERLAHMCGEFKVHNVTLAVFASLGSDLGRWVMEESTDIVILGRQKDNPGAFLAQDEDRVRAVIGPPAPSTQETAQLPPPVRGGAETERAPSDAAAEAVVKTEALAEGTEFEATPPPEREPQPEVPEGQDEEAAGDDYGGLLLTPEDPQPSASERAAVDDDREVQDLPVAEGAPDERPEAPERRSTVKWTDEPEENEPRSTGGHGTGTPWTVGGGKPADPWALAAAQVRAKGTEQKPPPAVIPRRSLEEPAWEAEEEEREVDSGIRFSVGPMLKRRSTLWGGGAIIAATLLIAFWPSNDGGASPFGETGSTGSAAQPEPPAEAGTVAQGPTQGAENPSPTTDSVTEVRTSEPEAAPETSASPVEAPAPPVAETQPPSAEMTAPHPRYSAGLAALGELDTALQWTNRMQAAVPAHLLYVAPVEVNGTVYFRVVAGLQEGATGVAGVISDLADATGQDGSAWIVRETEVAYALGDFGTVADARSRAAELTGQGIPAYTLALDFADGSVRYRVYAGGYPNATEAAYLGSLLEQAGITARLVDRIGRPPA